MVARWVSLVLIAVLGILGSVGTAGAAGDVIDVVEVDGLIDERLADFVLDVLASTDADLVILQVDSPGAVDGDIEDLLAGVTGASRPVAVWVGPAPAVAQGGSLQLLLAAPIRAAAPEVLVGRAVPTVAGGRSDAEAVADRFPDLPVELFDRTVEVSGPIDGVIDVVTPSIGQLVVGLDGLEVEVDGTRKTLATARVEIEDGLEVVKPAAEVRFRKPGLVDRILRFPLSPETAYLLLMIGLALIVFEFFAAGPGLAAAVGVLALLLSGSGYATLPVNWWAAALALAGVAGYVVDVQRHAVGLTSILGTGLLLVGGLLMTRGAPQVEVAWWAIVLIVAATALFFGVGMTTVARARFSTPTIGRTHLIGATGSALSALNPDGVVVIDEARWVARARRGAGIGPGDRIEVVAIDGLVLEVEPAGE